MEIRGYFNTQDDIIAWIRLQQHILPKQVALIHVGEDEGKISKRNILGSDEQFSRFVADNDTGFFLFSDFVSADVNLSTSKGKPNVYYFQDDNPCELLVSNSYKIIDSFSKTNALLVRACLDEELTYKNNVTVKLDIGKVESWVGRDIARYIPGIYWLNWISDSYAAMLNLDMSEIASNLDAPIERVGHGNMFRVSEDPRSWKEKLPAIRDMASKNERIFYVDKVDLRNVTTYAQLQKATNAWP